MSTDRDVNVFALLSDTHIPESPEITARGVNMTANLQRAVKEVLEHTGSPSQLFINGDCAYLKGLPKDYANLARCLAPVEQAGINMHLSMGNHDDRQPLFDALSNQRSESPPVMSKHVGIVESDFANWFLLDSLFEVDVVTGEIGGEQLKWLGGALDARSNKPAIVMVHHNPQFSPPAEGKPWGGISDTADLFDVLAARSHVKAMMYGHSHVWSQTQHRGIDLINLPAVAYVFSEDQPNGWVLAQLSKGMLQLTLNCFDSKHPKSGEVIEIAL